MTATLDSAIAPAAPAPAPDGAFGHRLLPPGDPLSGQTFDTIYAQLIEPELVKCEQQRRGALMIFLAGVGAAVVLAAGEIAIGTTLPGNALVTILILTLIFVPAVAYVPLNGVGAKAKLGVIQALCGPINVAYQPSPGRFDGFATFQSLHLLPDHGDNSFSDLFSGQRSDVGFALCNAQMQQGSGKNRRTVFQGQLFRLIRPRALASTTVVLRNSGWLNMFERPQGLQPIGLEDPVFNQAFAVFGSDQVEAREILTPSFMQELNDLESGYRAAHLRCGFEQAELLIAMQGSPRFGIGSLFSTLVDRNRVEHLARDIEQVFKLIDCFCNA